MQPTTDLHDVARPPHGQTARRPSWKSLPTHVREFIESQMGGRVTAGDSQGGGFTPGFASRLTVDTGARQFVKAAQRETHEMIADAYADEARKRKLLPSGIPAPGLLWAVDDGDWVMTGFECIDGRGPRRPWVVSELDACLATLVATAAELRTVPPGLDVRPLHDDIPDLLTGWDYVIEAAPRWPHSLEAQELAHAYLELPDTLHVVHGDARDDNFILDTTGRAFLCDWNFPALAPVWVDTVDLLTSAYGDGIDTEHLLASNPLTGDVDPEHIDIWLAVNSGYYLRNRDRPPVPDSPYLRKHQHWYAETSWSWLAQRRGWSTEVTSRA